MCKSNSLVVGEARLHTVAEEWAGIRLLTAAGVWTRCSTSLMGGQAGRAWVVTLSREGRMKECVGVQIGWFGYEHVTLYEVCLARGRRLLIGRWVEDPTAGEVVWGVSAK